MDPTAWTVIGSAVVILIAIATSFRSLRAQGDQPARADDAAAGAMAHLEGLLPACR